MSNGADLPIIEGGGTRNRPIAKHWSEIEALCGLCAEGKLYEVEDWISAGKPIQCELPDDRGLRKRMAPLEIAVDRGFHSLAKLLLVNGYDPNGDLRQSLSLAVENKNHSMLRLLLDNGADPLAVDFVSVLETYDRVIMDWFLEAGGNPCSQNALAKALRRKARPLLGFVKTHLESNSDIHRQVNIALCNFAREGDERGVALMLWLGGDPYAVVPYPDGADADDTDFHDFALNAALLAWHEPIVLQLLKKPIPAERTQEIFCSTAYRSHPELARRLLAMGANPNTELEGEHILKSLVHPVTWRYSSPEKAKRSLESVELVAAAGARWRMNAKQLASFRRDLLNGEPHLVKEMLDILRRHEVLDENELHELTRTNAMKALLSGNRHHPLSAIPFQRSSYVPTSESQGITPTRRYWKRHWSKR